MLRIAAFAALVAVAIAAPQHPAPYHAPAPVYAPAPHPAKYVDEAPKPYAFQYGVADDYSGAKFSAQENADGKLTHRDLHTWRSLFVENFEIGN